MGYDDIDIASELAVPLTSVRQPTHEMGYRAASLLLDLPADAPAEHVVCQPELVVRASSDATACRSARPVPDPPSPEDQGPR